MPPRPLRASKATAQYLPEAAQVAFLLDAARLLAPDVPELSAYLGRRALEVRIQRMRNAGFLFTNL